MGNGGINAYHRTALGNSFQGVVPVSLGPMHLHALMRIDFIGLKAYRCVSLQRSSLQFYKPLYVQLLYACMVLSCGLLAQQRPPCRFASSLI